MRDDELSRRLTALATAAEATARVAAAPSIRARAGRRRRRTVAYSLAAALGLTALVGYPIAAGTGPDEPAPPSVVWPDPTAIPPDLRMPHEGDPGFRRLDDPAVAGGFVPCRVVDPAAADATRAGRTDARTITGRDPDPDRRSPTYTQQLLVYADAAAATAAMRALVDDAARCGWSSAVRLGEGPEPERLHATRSLREPVDLDGPFGYGTALRRGNVLFVVFGEVEGSIMDGTDEAAMTTMDGILCASRRLCAARPAAEATWSPVAPSGGP